MEKSIKIIEKLANGKITYYPVVENCTELEGLDIILQFMSLVSEKLNEITLEEQMLN